MKEPVFKIVGEGGSLKIEKENQDSVEKFFYYHNEYDPIADEVLENVVTEYQSFEEAFQVINKKYPWYRLHLDLVHDDFKSYIKKELIKKLKDQKVPLSNLAHHLVNLNEKLDLEI